MTQTTSTHEKVMAGETASIENIHAAALSISLSTEDGCRVALDLAPGQVLGFTAGRENVDLTLHSGDPAGLRVIKPDTST
jgi:hypothetical protein